MRKLNHVSYKAALKIIPKRLKVASNTFHNYRKLSLNDKADIPYGQVRKLECIFGLNIGELANYSVDCKNLDVLIREPLRDGDTEK
ncbi:hypothetical protein [Pedobacter frigoris]|uniref:hypothetical protein n=1 Tax=Pedobacter frigoris TaxID=2571272 RepID=UPI0029310EEE|nr:hypothetical protein [Pedobacter frigoris]